MPAGVEGAQFFGGNKIDQAIFVPEYEEAASVAVAEDLVYNRFQNPDAFDELGARVGQSLQLQLNDLLYVEDKLAEGVDLPVVYADNLDWDSQFREEYKEARSPMEGLEMALEFYKRLDVAVISGKQLNDKVELRWEISIMWPNVWEARAIITGKSTVTLSTDQTKITKQVDELDKPDLLNNLFPQILPQFWDVYHILMSPPAELAPVIETESKGFFNPYSVLTLPPRLTYRPSLLDFDLKGINGMAGIIPNHAFTSIIKTMGPKRERYVTTSPIEVQLKRVSDKKANKITWTLPISVELQTASVLPYPGDEDDDNSNKDYVDDDDYGGIGKEAYFAMIERSDQQAPYEFQPMRKIATLPFGGDPNDPRVTNLRKVLYERVMKDGLKPKLDSDGRPQFFFRQHDVKTCFNEDGFGMAVYEYRPDWAASNEVALELEV